MKDFEWGCDPSGEGPEGVALLRTIARRSRAAAIPGRNN